MAESEQKIFSDEFCVSSDIMVCETTWCGIITKWRRGLTAGRKIMLLMSKLGLICLMVFANQAFLLLNTTLSVQMFNCPRTHIVIKKWMHLELAILCKSVTNAWNWPQSPIRQCQAIHHTSLLHIQWIPDPLFVILKDLPHLMDNW